MAREIDSGSLAANASEAFLDVFSSAVAVAGILLTWLRVPYVQGAVILVIALLIMRLGALTAWGAMLVLVDANLDPELQRQITAEINAVYGVKGVGEVRIRRAGPFRMVECTIATKPTLPLYEAHQLADQAELAVLRRYPQVESVFIHVEPTREATLRAIVPVEEMEGLSSRVCGHFARSPFFAVVRIPAASRTAGPSEVAEVTIEDFYLNEFLKEKVHVGLQVFKAVVRYRLDLVFTEQIGDIAFSLLKSNFVDVYSCPPGLMVDEAVARYARGELPRITAPTHPAAGPGG